MKFRFYLVDVFTDRRFGGNQLAVLPEAEGLSVAQMQSIATEFNFSESTFVLPPENSANTASVRIFTPKAELPFAGHPNVGTAFVLASIGDGLASPLRFEEQAGLVPVGVTYAAGRPVACELTAPQPLTLGDTLPVDELAGALVLSADDILTTHHAPRIASVGVPFALVELRDSAALARATVDLPRFAALLPMDRATGVHLYTRMFAPFQGVVEDPATGSANVALAALLAALDPEPNGQFAWRIAQGVEMGRPSRLAANATKQDGEVTAARIGGGCVIVADGWIEV